jgi:Holliday junction resolvase
VSKAKQKGTAAETAVVRYLREVGWPYAERLALSGNKDRGDVTGLPGIVVEVKACKTWDLAGWIKELQAEMKNAGADIGVLVVKRKGFTDPADWYWITIGSVMTDLLNGAAR